MATNDNARMGDTIVGNYNSDGTAISTETLKGDAGDLDRIQNKYRGSAQRMGTLLEESIDIPTPTTRKKPGRTRKTTTASHTPPALALAPPPMEVKETVKPKKSIRFRLEFGELKILVEDISYADLGIMLVFEREQDIVFMPRIGQELHIVDNNDREFHVMYSGMLFDWIDRTKKLMILIKVDVGDE